jgi:TonB-dependent SusC/RagA subfamily outer membrane receptor
MKRLTLILAFLLIAAAATAQDFNARWEKVIKLESEAKFKQAAAETDAIYRLAKKKRNEQQLLRAFFFKGKYLQMMEEDAQAIIIKNLQAEIKTATPATAALMQSLYAQMLYEMYNRNGYAIRQRTNVEGPAPEKFTEWSANHFTAAIETAFKQSIANRSLLYKTPLANYHDIIDFAPALAKTNRSLYDFLLEAYINFLRRNGYPQFNNAPHLQQYLLGDEHTFQKMQLPDSLAVQWPIIKLSLDTEAFYLAQKDTLAVQRAVLQRLEYAGQNIYSENKEQLLRQTYAAVSKRWGNTPFAWRAKIKLAQLYRQASSKNVHPEYMQLALQLCNEIIANEALHDVTFEAGDLKAQIESSWVRFDIERYIAPGKPALAKINFKEADSVTLLVYRVKNPREDAGEYRSSYESNDFYDSLVKNQKPVLTKTYALPKVAPYFDYSTEVALPGLEKGAYLVVVATPGAEIKGSSAAELQVSQIALSSQKRNNRTHYFITDRETGKPIPGVNAMPNDDSTAKKTDENGRVSFAHTALKSNHVQVAFIHRGDTLYGSYYDHYRDPKAEEMPRATVQLYFDRAIYRPGQKVFFKGIVTKHDKAGFTTVPDVYFYVYAEDASGNEIKEVKVKTNEFGSFTGEIDLPKNGMTGRYTLYVEEDDEPEEDPAYNSKEGEHPFWDHTKFEEEEFSFRVEEYKRPTFEATFNPVTRAYTLNDSITVTGTAKSFSGAPLSGAAITYRIRRTLQQRYYYDYGYDEDEYDAEEREEYQGGHLLDEDEITTDAQGNFSITFKAEPDEYTDTDTDRDTYLYTVYADVTDVNGETHTAQTTVKASATLLFPELTVPQTIDAAKGAEAAFNVKNANNSMQQVQGTLKVYKKTGNARLLAQRPWAAPDTPIMTEEEFTALFPHLPYQNTTDTLHNPQPYLVKQINTATDKTLALNSFNGWPSGEYSIELVVIDSLGRQEKAGATFSLTRKKDTFLPDNRLYSVRVLNQNPAKDGYAEIEIRTALPVLYGNLAASVNNTIIVDKAVTISNGKAVIKIPGVKNLQTLLTYSFDFVWQNNLYKHAGQVGLALPPDAVVIEAETLNSKLAPGGGETWTFTIKNGKNREAEVLASMYDASLDQFAKKDWNGIASYVYPGSDLPFTDLKTTGTDSGRLNNFIPFKGTGVRQQDSFYMYGFSIIKNANEYMHYQPREQMVAAGDITVKGTVTDAATGEALPGVVVIISGSTEGTVTDIDGTYTIFVAKGEKIVFSALGFGQVVMAPPATGRLNVTLEEDLQALEEVIVMGYGTQRKASLTGAVSTVEGNAMGIEIRGISSDVGNVSFVQSLQGRVPGLQVSTAGGAPGSSTTTVLRGLGSLNGDASPLYIIDGVPTNLANFKDINTDDLVSITVLTDAEAIAIYGNRGANGVVVITTKKTMEALKTVQTRKNFNETAFFYPQLKTDRKGNISFSFTTPEALTEWKLRLFAHNKKAVSGYLEKNFFTQKDLMVVPNMPRFLRETDTITLQAKITNLSAEPKDGTAMLQLLDAVTLEPVDGQMLNTNAARPFSVSAGGNTTVSWTIAVPVGLQGVQYKVVAKAGNFTDGEENILPVLPNSMLITESLPLWVRENTSKTYTLDNFKDNESATLRHQGITLEYTTNPAWLALRSLPYLMEFEHECSEQLFSRFYANSIAAHIMKNNPKIAEVFARWRQAGITPRLDQNPELKSILLAETPWVLDAQSEEEQNARLATLFDLDKITAGLDANFKKLQERQGPSGGFAWFPGYQDSEYITRHIMAGFGHLNTMGIFSRADSTRVANITRRGVHFIDNTFVEWHNTRNKRVKDKEAFRMWYPYSDLHYLYTRSFYVKQYPPGDSMAAAIKPYISYTKQHWPEFTLYEKGLAALVLHRFGETAPAKKIMAYLKESSASNQELGMYWTDNTPGWWWYRAPIETHALLIEAFAEIENDAKSIDAMRVWLIKQKQNKHWPTTKATAEAVYALLMKGTDWLGVQGSTTFSLGSKALLDEKMASAGKEAGTGYIKLQWKPEEITPDMAVLTVQNSSAVPGCGGFYWQYFENLDKIKPAQQGIMSVKKELYRKNTAVDDITLQPITAETPLKVGDLVTVRLVITLTEDAEYVHLKDMRASAFEPVDVLSGHHYKDGLGYYQSTRDAATNFFFDRITRGTYVLEYDLRVNNAGQFSNGISTIQSMYAPEFSGHTQGIRVKTE